MKRSDQRAREFLRYVRRNPKATNTPASRRAHYLDAAAVLRRKGRLLDARWSLAQAREIAAPKKSFAFWV